MKVSDNWLRQWVAVQQDAWSIADQITMAGLEVDAVTPVAADFSAVVVALVTEVAQHPDADRLRVCQLDDGSGAPRQVVCGAPNVAAGQKVALALPGAVLPGDMQIAETTLRGVASSGMICAESELGLVEEKSPGIWVLPDEAPVGEALRRWLTLDDYTIEVDLTPNRGDCLSLAGLARELGVLNRLEVQMPSVEPVAPVGDEQFDIGVADTAACPRYASRILRDVDVGAPTPLWMAERLRRSGVRSIDVVVDVTNYVMLELGQPMHAFDLERLNQRIEVRYANQNEQLELLDGQQVTLDGDTLLIADAEGPLAIAGVMGGERSGVNDRTRHVLLESAFFAPLAVAGRARRYGLHTDASHRFERGVDPTQQVRAIERATRLLRDIAGGTPGPTVEVCDHEQLPLHRRVALDAARVARLLGMSLAHDDIADILTRLGMTLEPVGEGQWQVGVPAWRFDIEREEDLIEELARIHGYNRLPVRYPRAELAPARIAGDRVPLDRLRHVLVAAGYQEAITYSFVSATLQHAFAPQSTAPVLANPISSDMSVMRSSLWAGLVRAVMHNLNRQQQRVRLFESGRVFEGSFAADAATALEQTPMIAGMICGSRDPEGWSARRDAVDFFDLKGDVERLIEAGGTLEAWRFEAAEHPALHPGQSARIVRDGRCVGWLGALHPQLREALGIKVEIYAFQLELEALTQGRVAQFTPLSRYPEVRRDLALIVEESVTVQSLLDVIRDEAGDSLVSLRLFDIYRGAGVAEGYKSLALGLTWQHPSRTLTDGEINHITDNIVAVTAKHCGAVLRG